MSSTQWDVVAFALADTMRAVTGYRHPESTSGTVNGIPVFIGPTYGLTNERPTSWLSVAWSGEPENAQPSGNTTQVAGPISPLRNRDESGLIICRACYQDGNRGDAAMRTGIAGARQMISDVESATRTNPLLGLTQPTMKWAFVTAVTAPVLQLAGGIVVSFDFTVGYEARL